MRRLIAVLALVLIPALASAQVTTGSPFGGGGGGTASVLSVFGNRMVVCPVKTLSNTSATVQDIATITTTSASAGAALFFWTTTASNGTLANVETYTFPVVWHNNAGTVTAAVGTTANTGSLDASGTLTHVASTSTATNVVTVRIAPSWTVIVPTVVLGYATILVESPDSVVCL